MSPRSWTKAGKESASQEWVRCKYASSLKAANPAACAMVLTDHGIAWACNRLGQWRTGNQVTETETRQGVNLCHAPQDDQVQSNEPGQRPDCASIISKKGRKASSTTKIVRE